MTDCLAQVGVRTCHLSYHHHVDHDDGHGHDVDHDHDHDDDDLISEKNPGSHPREDHDEEGEKLKTKVSGLIWLRELSLKK